MKTAETSERMAAWQRAVARFRRWRTHFHCLACGEYFPRDKAYCPYCKTHKGGRGQNLPPLGSA